MQMAAYRVSLCPRDSGLFRLGLGRPRSRADRAHMAPLPHLLSPCPRAGARTLFTDTRHRVEHWWHPRIMEQWQRDTLEESSLRKKFYVLSMFPYPSGHFHMGHVRVYTISDTIGHFQRMRGHQVLNPMGWDAFGLPAENAAIERGLDPEEWTKSNIQSMREQLDSLGLCFNWDKEVTTCLPDYYRWTQWLFVKLFKAGLAYQKEAVVNWDPVDQTVLADEQVDDSVRGWRSGALVEQKLLRQWFIKTTNYAKPLLDALVRLTSLICSFLSATSSPEAVFGAAYLSIVPSHRLLHGTSPVRSALERVLQTDRDCLTEVTAHNLFTSQELPLVISSKKEFEGHLDTVIGIPDRSVEDASVARALSWSPVLKGHEDGGHTLLNSAEFTGLSTEETKVDGHLTSTKLRNWRISRQRYWGKPITMVHCGSCGPVAVPEEQLPVTLPKLPSLTGKGASPLEHADDWISCTCPRCKGPARWETDTMDTFVDSSWYYFRYTDPHNQDRPFERYLADHWLPVDVYIRGKEHAVMHLYYARFLSHFCRDQGLVGHREPFKKLLVQGLIKGQTFRAADRGRETISTSQELVQVGRKAGLQVTWEKMSKSKHNGLDAQEVVQQYGIDTVRLYVLYAAPPEQDILWDVKTLFILQSNYCMLDTHRERRYGWLGCHCDQPDLRLQVTGHFTEDFLLNAAISRLMGLTNTLSNVSSGVLQHSVEFEEALSTLCVMTAPMAPHLASELWAALSRGGDVLQQPWPTPDPLYLETPDTLELVVRINNKVCGTVLVPQQVAQDTEQVRALVLGSELGQHLLGYRTSKKAILFPRTAIINFLIEE
uniref:leucine--tRNA ligase n=1 Tax=Salmo trutta TaxID=8032 RepID=A0A674A3Z6_SALTR